MGSGECDCDCNCPMNSQAVNCAPGFSKVCPMMGDQCPESMEQVCPSMPTTMPMPAGRMMGAGDRGCQCVPDFLLSLVMGAMTPAGRSAAVDRAMTKVTFKIGKTTCKCQYDINEKDCKKSKFACDKKCNGKISGLELDGGNYVMNLMVKKGKVAIQKCEAKTTEPTGTGGGPGSGPGNGGGSGMGSGPGSGIGGGMGGMGTRCACVSMGGGPMPPTGSGSGPMPPTGSGPKPPTGSGTPGSRSYLAGISYSFDTSNSPFCAGTLISDQWLLTTASCSYSDTKKTGVDKVNVILGEETLGTPQAEDFKVASVERIFVHPDYSTSSVDNNIALWKLSEPVSTSVYSPACLPPQDSQQEGQVKLVGWRVSELVGSLEQSITEVDGNLVSNTECNVGDTQLCSTSTGCRGDLGGPLLHGEKTLVGLTAWDKGCSKSSYGIYTRTAKFTTWILNKISSNGGGDVCTT